MGTTTSGLRASSVFAAALFLVTYAGAQVAGDVNRIVLRVNNQIATLYDYESLKREQLASLAQASVPESRRQEILAGLGEQTMQNLFQELLMLSRAEQLSVTVSTEQLDAAVQETMTDFGITDPAELEIALSQNGLTLPAFREQIRRSLAIREVMGREVQQRIKLEDEDLRRYYRAHPEQFRKPKKIRLREIVVLDSSDLGPEERAQLGAGLRQAILAGSVDEELATHEESGRTTGWIDHDWVEPKDLDSTLAAAAETLAAGEVSEPVAARGGLHLLQVVEVQESAIREFNDVRDWIEGRERNRLFEAEMRQYMEELVESSHIVSRPPPEAATFRPVLGSAGASAAVVEPAVEGVPEIQTLPPLDGEEDPPVPEAPSEPGEPSASPG